MNAITIDAVKTALIKTSFVGRCIKDLGKVPSGVLYASMMTNMGYTEYMAIIATLKRTGLVREENNVLIWDAQNVENN